MFWIVSSDQFLLTSTLLKCPPYLDKCFGQSLSSLDVSIDMVWEKLCKLNPSMSSGPDGYHPHVFREVKEGFIFTISEISGYWLPRPWKDATVTPIFKKGCRTLPTNYCPVSLTSIVCRIYYQGTYNELFFIQRTIEFIVVSMAFDLCYSTA